MMSFAFAVSLTMAMQAAPAMPPAPPVEAAPPAAAMPEEEEICRRMMVEDPKTPGRAKARKVCKTREEWKAFATRRT